MTDPFPTRTLIHPEVRERLAFLDGIEGSTFEAYQDAISRPGTWYHIRANVIKNAPDRILVELVEHHGENWIIQRDARLQEAIQVKLRGPRGIEPVDKTVLIDAFSAESVGMGAPLFAPGFKQALRRFPKGDLVGMVTRFTSSWDGTAHEVHCGNGIAEFPSNTIHEPERGVVVTTTESWYASPPIQSWAEYAAGKIIDQNFPSMLAARALAPVPGNAVLDMCCGAGGKTTHVAQLMENKGNIVAVDRASVKINRLRERAARMGITCITPVVSRSERMKDAVAAFQADRVLVDPPCSALGLRLRLCIDETRKDLDNYRANQSRILEDVMRAGVVRQGTRLVYCTCTVTREENELMVVELIDKHGFKIVDPGFDAGHPGVPVDRLSKSEVARLRRFYPHVDDTIGFFIATMEKA
ncbi:MAG: RsmB/NOP family class I SAM-dependent RNA methyltransferase [Candidatus Lokiarchaeota archaeon]|nr:RsmB/NOP family class I SAM-dependent RNA methyltransferase [Candidatus Lokiarchaeota archaeon]